MCKCCQQCLESCYWHLIEKRFCFDEQIALYQEPLGKGEKNNNMFDNMAFYDSVAIIAGRAIVTIDPLPEKKDVVDGEPVMQQPRRLRWHEQGGRNHVANGDVVQRAEPAALLEGSDDSGSASSDQENRKEKEEEKSKPDDKETSKKAVTFENAQTETKETKADSQPTSTHTRNLTVPDVEIRKKSLRERRMSKSLYLKIDFPKEVPVIRQNSMPKFFMDTPEHNQTESTLVKGPLTALQTPMAPKEEFSYDLYSVVQREKTKTQPSPREIVPIHRESSRLALIKEKIKLKKSKSTVSASNIPHSNYI